MSIIIPYMFDTLDKGFRQIEVEDLTPQTEFYNPCFEISIQRIQTVKSI